jgi:hypothetical protein
MVLSVVSFGCRLSVAGPNPSCNLDGAQRENTNTQQPNRTADFVSFHNTLPGTLMTFSAVLVGGFTGFLCQLTANAVRKVPLSRCTL